MLSCHKSEKDVLHMDCFCILSSWGSWRLPIIFFLERNGKRFWQDLFMTFKNIFTCLDYWKIHLLSSWFCLPVHLSLLLFKVLFYFFHNQIEFLFAVPGPLTNCSLPHHRSVSLLQLPQCFQPHLLHPSRIAKLFTLLFVNTNSCQMPSLHKNLPRKLFPFYILNVSLFVLSYLCYRLHCFLLFILHSAFLLQFKSQQRWVAMNKRAKIRRFQNHQLLPLEQRKVRHTVPPVTHLAQTLDP